MQRIIFTLYLVYLTIIDASSQVPLCDGINLAIIACLSDNNTIAYSYNFDMNFSLSDNKTLPNKAVISRYNVYTTGNYSIQPTKFKTRTNELVERCSFINESCVLNFPDDTISFHNVIYPNEPDIRGHSVIVQNGKVFNKHTLTFFTESQPCTETCKLLKYVSEGKISSLDSDNYSSPARQINFTVCCNHFVYIEVPDINDYECEEFETNTVVTNVYGGPIAIFGASQQFMPDGLLVNITQFDHIDYHADYTYEVNDYNQCYSLNGEGGHKPNCSQLFRFPLDDFQFDFSLAIKQHPQYDEYGGIVGQLIRRNGVYLKDGNVTYTPTDPCWNHITYSPIVEEVVPDGVMVNSSFCCTRFKKNPDISTNPILPAPTTLAPNFCKKYHSVTSLSDNSAYLEAEYAFTSNYIEIHIDQYFAAKDSLVQLEAYSSDLFSQICTATTQNPTNVCNFTLSNDHKYELQMRTSIMPEGFNMLNVVEENNQFITPFLTQLSPCHNETNPCLLTIYFYNLHPKILDNYGNLNTSATTIFCCTAFA